MVKKPIKSNGTSRIRFIMLEAEMPEGDLTQITNAIQNALRPTSLSGPRVARPSVQVIGSDDDLVDDASDVADEADEEAIEAPTKQSTPRPKKPAKRKVVDIDLEHPTSFAEYVSKHVPKSDQDKYLVAVAFLSEHRPELEGASVDHVYTCFRKMGWSTGAKDFGQPLRNLKVQQLVDQGKSKGTYATNHIGLDRVRKLAGD